MKFIFNIITKIDIMCNVLKKRSNRYGITQKYKILIWFSQIWIFKIIYRF